jgi:hypothetical protein
MRSVILLPQGRPPFGARTILPSARRTPFPKLAKKRRVFVRRACRTLGKTDYRDERVGTRAAGELAAIRGAAGPFALQPDEKPEGEGEDEMRKGRPLVDAALEGARLRLRP